MTEHGYSVFDESYDRFPLERAKSIYLIYRKHENEIKIRPLDWRDNYFTYRIERNDVTLFDTDLTLEPSYEDAIETMLKKMKRYL